MSTAYSPRVNAPLTGASRLEDQQNNRRPATHGLFKRLGLYYPLSTAEAQPEADVFCGCQRQV